MAKASTGSFVWYEHLTNDPRAALAFYTEVIGWKAQPFGDDYTMLVGTQGPLGGVYKLPDEAKKMGAPPHWIASVQVDDVDAVAAKAKQLGGKVFKAPEDLPTIGRSATIGDPQGAAISLFKPLQAMDRHDPSKPGEICWNELQTSDGAAGYEFYSALFGWKQLEEMDMGAMGKYRIYGVGETQLGGMMTAPKGMPAMWVYYINLDDIEGTLKRATSRGAKLINGPMDVPGGGRVAQLTDPQGAVFALHQQVRK